MTLANTMTINRRVSPVNFSAPLVLEPPRHCGLSTIALIPGRHLIGSAHGCGIRLQADGIQDRHALILVGENRTVVKSMDSRTWVNDSPVVEMALRHGDRLSIGPLTFRVRLASPEEAVAFSVSSIPVTSPSAVQPSLDHPTPETVSGDAVQTNEFATAELLASAPSQIEPAGCESSIREMADSDGPSDPVSIDIMSDVSRLRPAETLTSRLDEIQQRLADLQQTSALIPIEPQSGRKICDSNAFARNLEIQAQRDELQRRADEIATQTIQLNARIAAVSEREEQVNRQQESLVREAERLAEVAETARRNLAAEHGRLSVQWREWDEQYHRMTHELTAQCDGIERQRAELRAEAEQIAAGRVEIQSLRATHERDWRTLASERARLASESAELQGLRSQLDSERQHQRNVREDAEARLVADRLTLTQDRELLAADRREFENDKARLADDRSALGRQFEQVQHSRAELQAKLEEDRQQLLIERQELDSLRRSVDRDACRPQTCETTSDQPAEWNFEVWQNRDAERRCENEEIAAQTSYGSASLFMPDQFEAPPLKAAYEAPDWNAYSTPDKKINSSSEFLPLAATNETSPYPCPATDRLIPDRAGHMPAVDVPSRFETAAEIDPFANYPDPSCGNASDALGLHSDNRLAAMSESTTVMAPERDGNHWNCLDTQSGWAVTGIAPAATLTETPLPFPNDVDVADTLAAVNRQFGMALEEAPAGDVDAVPSSLPSWWKDAQPDVALDRTATPEVRGATWMIDGKEAEVVEPTLPGRAPEEATVSENPIVDLRSQLAKMFDLPGTALPETLERESHVATLVVEETVASEQTLQVQPDAVTGTHSQVESSPSDDANVDDSVEAFMARLLARSRNDAEALTTPVAAVASNSVVSDSGSDRPTSVQEQPAALPGDLSHLLSEPKHKQDKQAVRENLQSFRQVAHLSARSALARHSFRQLRNATIAKGVLFGVSLVAASVFLMEPLSGRPIEVWKVAGCCLAALLSGLEFHRSWRQLRKPIIGSVPEPAQPEPASKTDLEQSSAIVS